MDGSPATPLRIGSWRVDPATGVLSRNGESVRVEARSMRLLLCLAARAGQVVSIDELLDQAWAGVIVTPDSVYQAITSLRRLLGDDSKQPSYIATVPRLGYRLVASTGPWVEPVPGEPEAAPPVGSAASSRRRWAMLGGGALLLLALAACIAYVGLASGPSRSSVAVLPLLDLTSQAMNEEYFADGMTEELIDQLSKLPRLRVPSPTASLYFKDKSLPLAEMARKLDVAYVVDGSVRESGAEYRVAVRLVRARDGDVIWTASYDRPLGGDVLAIQKDIAARASPAVQAAIERANGGGY